MTIKVVKKISRIEFIREAVEDSTKISAHMKHLIEHRPKKDTIKIFENCETKADIEKKCEEMEKLMEKVSEYVDREYVGA